MKYVGQRGKMSIEKWVFRGKMGVIGLEKFRSSNQTRKTKWCKMWVLFLKMDKTRGMRKWKW